MKHFLKINKKLLLFFLLLSQIIQSQKIIHTQFADSMNVIFQHLDKTKIPHKLLINYGMEFIEISGYNGIMTSNNFVNRNHLTSIYKTLLMSKVDNSITSLLSQDDFNNNWDDLRMPNKIILSGLYYKYSEFYDNAPNNSIIINGNKLYDKFNNGIWQNPYIEKRVFAVAPPIMLYKHLNMQVEFPLVLWYTNQSNNITQIFIDFGDGLGYQNILFGQTIHVNYSSNGKKEWKYKLTLSNNEVLYSHSTMLIDAPTNTNYQPYNF